MHTYSAKTDLYDEGDVPCGKLATRRSAVSNPDEEREGNAAGVTCTSYAIDRVGCSGIPMLGLWESKYIVVLNA